MNYRSIFLLLFVLFSCIRKEHIPSDVLNQRKMVGIMTELHIAESKVNTYGIRSQDTAKAVFMYYEDSIFKRYKINKKQYLRSYDYYMRRPELAEELYKAVSDSLASRKKKKK